MKRSFLLCSTFLPVVALACTSVSGNDPGDEGDGSAGSPDIGASTGGSGDGDGTGATTSSTGGGVLKEIGTGGTVDPGAEQITEEESCTGTALEPETIEVPQEVTTTTETQVPAPVALYVMLDNTLSMDEMGATASKWDEAVSALTSFVEDPASEGIDVAIQYFHPTGGSGQEADECDGVAHATPAVAMGTLPDQAPAIVRSLQSTRTALNTPTGGALTGATNYCATFQTEHPDEKCVVILVTDGEPHGCGLSAICPNDTGGGGPGMGGGSANCVDPNSASVLTPIAAAGLANGVVTFTVGMAGVSEDGFTLLDQVAVAGGSDCTPGAPGDEACDVSTTGAEGLLAALNAIRDSVTVVETHTETFTTTEIVPLPCEWTLPEPPKGSTLDPMLVNVNIVDAATTVTTPATYVPSADDCSRASGPAWYYDDPVAPTKMYVCPATCELLAAMPTASVQVLLGCERKDLM
ncbi:MAG: VWA domain-containing protein [Polyangiaceae bacterium]|nr:VWA domain-containing protein [Polyangiaceae bacterium]